MKKQWFVSLGLLGLSFMSEAAMITVATDDANNYGDQWAGNGGTGFDAWHFITDSASGSAGNFLASKSGNTDLNHIASNPSDKAWGTYANGAGFNQFEAYRGFTDNSLQQTGDRIQLSIEHGAITQGGAAGFTLRNQNTHNDIGDYNQLSRFEFGFIGGQQHYSIFDDSGVIDTGIGFTDAGLNLSLSLLSDNDYQLDIFNAFDGSLIQSRNGVLAGSGSIDSVALYNRDTELANVYFNGLSITTDNAISVPEPASWMTLALGLTGLLLRKKLSS